MGVMLAASTELDPSLSKLELSARVHQLHAEVLDTSPALCAERALLITDFFRRVADRKAPMVVQKAAALAHVLRNKRARIYPQELLVGCSTSHRVGGGLFPELHGLAVLEDLFVFDRRPVNPFTVSWQDRFRLITEVVPFWLPRMLPLRAFGFLGGARFIAEQLDAKSYLINETGGISHFVPSYASLLRLGTEGFRRQAAERLATLPRGAPEADFLRAVGAVCKGLEQFAAGYQAVALRLAHAEPEAQPREELQKIAAVCGRAVRYPARSFHEALQSILFVQIALNLESLDNAVSPGRLDQVLYPYYRRDCDAGRLDATTALELLGCFAVKLCEIVPLFSRRITRYHGGLFNGQALMVGGLDEAGQDATNELSHLFLELMARLRTRQPNYHARIHSGSPPAYRAHIARTLAAGAGSPALYNDDVIVPIVRSRGVSEVHARDYSSVGCVEPVPAGRGYMSTDAALMNLPLYLELALNQGRQFGGQRRTGVATIAAQGVSSTDELLALFGVQLRFAVRRLLHDLRGIEQANTDHHPTPLTSVMLEGCLQSGQDASAGGAMYNGSGVQGVGAVEVGDSLAAIEQLVFVERRLSMAELIEACRSGFAGADKLRLRLQRAAKFGDDDARADRWVGRVCELFAASLEGSYNSRGGQYVAGFYSVTCHQAFGEVVGALPSGRGAGEPFSSGISPACGGRQGPTAALRSAASLPSEVAKNGFNFNFELAPWMVAGADGAATLQSLIDGGFASGCMQLQLNVIDPQILIEARDNPGRHRGLLVRVSGYSAYFDDLSPAMQQEVIDRMVGHGVSAR